jgi:serine/threonine protein kinase
MRTCQSCGFENAEPGRACPLCGGSEVMGATLGSEQVTLEMPRSGPARESRVAVGRVFDGRYRVEAELGRGGMGQVFRVRDTRENRDAALKVLHPVVDDDPDRIERFRREIAVLSRIRHPAVPKVVGWGVDEGDAFFVSELVEGHDLKIEIQQRGARPAPEVAALGAAVADALTAAHALGIVHRDVKPNNIMIATDGTVRLLDFGLARGMGIDLTSLTRTGTIVGTPGYMSPEQFDGLGVDERSDLYSLGVVLFELVTGRLPFTGQTPLAVAMKHKTEPPPLPRSLNRDVPAWMERVVLTCLEKDPGQRFHTAAELATELRRPRMHHRPSVQRLPTGDTVLHDESGQTDWALVLRTPREKTGWTPGLALAFAGRHFKLQGIDVPAARAGRWTYRFLAWPEGEIFRRLVDYDEDCAQRASAGPESLSDRLSRWMTPKSRPD